MLINEKLNPITNPASGVFDSLNNLGIHIKTSSTAIAASAKRAGITAITGTQTLKDTKYALAEQEELVNCIQPKAPNSEPVVLSIKTKSAITGQQVNTTCDVQVDVQLCGIEFVATATLELDAVGDTANPNTLDINQSKFLISQITIADNTKFNASKLFSQHKNKNINFKEGTGNLNEMTLEQLQVLFTQNTLVASAQAKADANGMGVYSVLELQPKEEIIIPPKDKKTDENTDEKTTWTDFAIITTAIVSTIGALLLIKMSFSPSNSEYHDNIKFDDYKDEITI